MTAVHSVVRGLRRSLSVTRELGNRVLGNVGAGEPAAKIITDAQTYWERPGDDRWQSNSHWRGSGVFAGSDLWDRVGSMHLNLYDRMSRMIEAKEQLGTIVEWGCGGGANAVKFAPRGTSFVGVDISTETLEECARQVAATSSTPFTGVLIDVAKPETALDRIEGRCDLFLCVYVFELITSQEYGARLLRVAHEMLSPGGHAFIQVKYDPGAFWTRSRRRSYLTGLADMTTYRIDEFWTLAEDCGLRAEAVHLVPENDLDRRYAYFLLTKPA